MAGTLAHIPRRKKGTGDVHMDTRGQKVIKYGEHLSHCPVPLWRSRCFSNNQDPQWANGIFFYLKELDEFTLQNRRDRYGGCEFKDCKVRPYLKTKTEPGNPGLLDFRELVQEIENKIQEVCLF